jgi:predicted  nucleic acid-binding Zn-ribbon protein
MKKFSKINNIKVDELKTNKVEANDPIQELKHEIHGILDNLLSVRTYGPISRYHTAGTMKVEGKEMVVDAIIDMLSEKENKKTIKLLESMKTNSKDHELIDNAIDSLKNENKFLKKENFNIKMRIKSISERYKDDEDFIQYIALKAKDMNPDILNIIDGVDISEKRRNVIKEYLSLIAR